MKNAFTVNIHNKSSGANATSYNCIVHIWIIFILKYLIIQWITVLILMKKSRGNCLMFEIMMLLLHNKFTSFDNCMCHISGIILTFSLN